MFGGADSQHTVCLKQTSHWSASCSCGCFSGNLRIRLRWAKSRDSYRRISDRRKASASFHGEDFAPREPECGGSSSGMRIFEPEFWGRILGSNFLVLCFPRKRAPSKIHPREIHRPKFMSINSLQNSGWKIHIALLQGHFANKRGVCQETRRCPESHGS